MARLNQSAGRTPRGWKARYQARSATIRRRIAELQSAGVEGLGETTAPVAGPGVPGGKIVVRATRDGVTLTHAELMALCSEHDIG